VGIRGDKFKLREQRMNLLVIRVQEIAFPKEIHERGETVCEGN